MIKLYPYPDVMQSQPLDRQRLAQRLEEDGYLKKAEKIRNSGREDDSAYRSRSLVITWDKAPGARWVLNIPESFVSFTANPNQSLRISESSWTRQDDQHCSLSCRTDNPKGELRCDFRAGPERIDIQIIYSLNEQEVLQDLMCQACFNHLWADGFGRDAYILLDGQIKALRDEDPEGKKEWRRFITLKEADRHEKYYRWAVYRGAERRFIATMRQGNDPLTVAICSAQAVAVSWSFWPCTDMDFDLGNVWPASPGRASGVIHFLQGPLEESLHKISLV